MHYAIIAAGEGSRLRQEGVEAPKPLTTLCGETMIDRLIRLFLANDAESVSIIVNEEMAVVSDYLLAMRLPVPLHIVVRSTPGSMHSFYALKEYLKAAPFCLTTVDTLFREDEFANYIKSFRANCTNDGSMAVTDYIDDEKPLYVETNSDNAIISFRDSHYPGAKYISGGVYALQPQAIEILEQAMQNGVERMRDYQRALIAAGMKLKAHPFSKIIDIDHAEDITKAEKFLKYWG